MTEPSAPRWDAIVIGSGLGGLSAAAALALEGRRVLVLERLGNLGGAATNYRHGQLTMEASLHEIDGEELNSPHGVVRRLGLAEAITPIRTAEFYQVRGPFLSAPLTVPHGLAAAEAALAAAFPDAAAGIAKLYGLLRRLDRAVEGLQEVGARGPAAALPLLFSGKLFDILGEAPQTVAHELDRLLGAHEGAKMAFGPHLAYFDDDPAQFSFLMFAVVTAHYLEGGAYYLQGGSRSLTLALAQKVIEARGELLRHRTAVEIALDGEGRACGVRHLGPDGAERFDAAEIVLGNANPEALAAMLPPERRAAFAEPYGGYRPSISLFTVSLGLDRPAAEFGVEAYTTWIYPDWMTRFDQYPASGDVFGGAPGAALPMYGLNDYARLSPALGAPEDLRLLTLTGVDRLWAWEGYDEDADKARRAAWTEAFIADLDRRFPGIAGAVRHSEMATARTLRNRLGTPHGEAYGFRPTPQRLFGRPPSPRTAIPGLWLASAYTVSGGYAGAMHGGVMAAEAALADESRRLRRRWPYNTLLS